MTVAPVDLPYLQIYRVRGKPYAYYRRDGARTRLPDPAGPAFLAAYQAAHAAAEARARPQALRSTAVPGSFKALVELFRADPEYRLLAPKTRRDYDRLLQPLLDKWGDHGVARMPRAWVLGRRAALQDTPRTANYTVAVIARLMAFAVDREWRPDNPALRIKALPTGPGHRAWTDAEIGAATGKEAPAWLRRAVMLALYTGQRQGDVLAMPWVRYQDGTITLRQGKSRRQPNGGAELRIPVHPVLRAELARGERVATVMCTRRDGRAWTGKARDGSPGSNTAFQHAFAEARAELGLSANCTFHGLRHSAASRMAEAGASDAEIAAITGHRTRDMVAHYSAGARQEKLARAAIHALPKRRPQARK